MRLRDIRHRLRQHPLAHVGPGLITGVADDDPSGIVTYSQAGAQFGLDMLWTMPLAFPLMAAIQSICARIGRATGQGLAANMKAAFPPWLLRPLILLLLIANIFNIAADIAAMGDAAALVSGLPAHAMTCFFVALILALQIFVPYHRYVVILRWLTLSLLAYVAVLFTLHVPWRQALLRTVWPHLRLDRATATMVTGLFGTTISPYLFFWQASEEVEDMQNRHAPPLLRDAAQAPPELRRIAWDSWTGMFYSNAVAFFVILATAVTLHAAGITTIDTAAQAAAALRPLAGPLAALLFALGIFGVGMIGVPVLAGSGAYALAEAMGWQSGLERRAKDARGFYAIIAFCVLLALVIQYSPLPPMRALFWSAVINGIAAVPLMAVILVLTAKRSVMGAFTAPWPLLALGWIATLVMAAAAIVTI